jgi:hypothetical protein
MRKVEHIGIAVRNLEAAHATYAALFGEEHYKIEGVESGRSAHRIFSGRTQ